MTVEELEAAESSPNSLELKSMALLSSTDTSTSFNDTSSGTLRHSSMISQSSSPLQQQLGSKSVKDSHYNNMKNGSAHSSSSLSSSVFSDADNGPPIGGESRGIKPYNEYVKGGQDSVYWYDKDEIEETSHTWVPKSLREDVDRKGIKWPDK
jgi:hypothetical protein